MKTATLWKPADSGTATDTQEGFSYLLESGDHMLLESSGDYLLEGSVVTVHTPQLWAETPKTAVAWKTESGFATFTAIEYTRITEASDTRITETGDIRVTEGSVQTDKLPTTWTNN